MNRKEYRFASNEEADYNKPLTMAQGVCHVTVNGKFAVKNGQILQNGSGLILGPNGRIL
jgi:uncharacterized Zn-binding protein involved in type VI secretion